MLKGIFLKHSVLKEIKNDNVFQKNIYKYIIFLQRLKARNASAKSATVQSRTYRYIKTII